MWSTSAGGHLMKVVNLTGFTVYKTTVYVFRMLQHRPDFICFHSVKSATIVVKSNQK